MEQIRIEKGRLSGYTLDQYGPADLQRVAASRDRTRLQRASFYKQTLANVVFAGITFSDCSFARACFERVSFRNCRFRNVDLTRSRFVDCFISNTTFEDCDPYYVSFENTEVPASAFKRCYKDDEDWNKALLLFSALRRSLQEIGNVRQSRAAEYYLRVWERRRMFLRWRHKDVSAVLPWLFSIFVGGLTGYGERPAYLTFWIIGLISLAASGYMKWFPAVVSGTAGGYLNYWYFSFRIFCAQGFGEEILSARLLLLELAEFAVGLVLISMLIGSITRKFST